MRYIKQTKSCICLVFMIFLSLPAWAVAQDCDLGKQYYNEARQEQDLNRVEILLKNAIDVCPTFSAWYLLGRVQDQVSSPEKAIVSLEKALALASNPKSQALALARIGQIQAAQTEVNLMEIVQDLKTAVKLHPDPPTWMSVLVQDLEIRQRETVVSAKEIMAGLNADSQANQRALKNFGATPSINLSVNFDSNDDNLTPQSRRQVLELGEALNASEFRDNSFLLIGHTDKRGTNEYNLVLSERRAQTVYQELLRLYPRLSYRLERQGRGEAQLLYTGDTEKSHRLNRRLEVTIIK